MKRTLLLLALGVCFASPAFAQQSDTPAGPPPPPPGEDHPQGGHMGMLSDAERQELMTAREAAFKADPTLETQQKAIEAQQKALRQKIDAAMVQADPKVAPILAKIDAAHQHHDGQGQGPGGPPPSGKPPGQ